MTNVLRINQGALSAKATLVDGDWNALSLSEQAVGPHYLSDGRVEQYSRDLPAYLVAQVATRYQSPASRSTGCPSPVRTTRRCLRGILTSASRCRT